jgi:hypothetical protein
MEAGRDRGVRRACDVLVALAFACATVVVPLRTDWLETGSSGQPREFRAPAKMPAKPEDLVQALAWPQQFDAWYRDHFGMRASLIRWHNLAKIELFEVSPTSEIVLGPDHWMYTTRDRAVDVYRGADPFTQEELDLWVQVLEDRREWCAQRGVKYLFAIATNKETVYPERFPARFDKIGPTRREQLVEVVRTRSDFPLLDLTDALLAEKARRGEREPIFFPLGTHWNDFGAVAAYRALIERVAELDPRVKPRPESDFSFAYTAFQDDSWAGRLYLEDRLVQDNDAMEFARAIPAEWWEENGRIRALDVTTPDRPDSGLPRAVMFHDSMGEKLRPLVAEHFRSATFKWVSADFDAELIEREKPDVVIQLFVERALAATSLSNSPMDTQERLAREFAGSSRVLLESLDGLTPQASDAHRKVDLSRRSDGALAIAYGHGSVYLPPLDVPPGSWAVLRFDVEAPAPTVMVFEFLTRRFTDYSTLARGFTRPIAAGRGTLFVKLRVPELAGRVRFHFGGVQGEYVLHSLEARAVPR